MGAVYQRAARGFHWKARQNTHLVEILDSAAVIRTKLAKVVPAATGKEQPAQELMILLHTGPFLIKRAEISTADELREFAGPILDWIQITQAETAEIIL